MLLKHLLVLVAFVPFVVSDPCRKGDFYWPQKKVCLPEGGPSHHSSPPYGTKCPDDDWYWHDDRKCCVPRQKQHSNPRCPDKWVWDNQRYGCRRYTPPSPPYHQPSPKPGNNYGGNNNHGNNNNGNNGNNHGNNGNNNHGNNNNGNHRHRRSTPVAR